MVRRVDSPPYTINEGVLRRFSQRMTVFGRMLYDDSIPFYKKHMYTNIEDIILNNDNGYSFIDYARMMGSWTVYDYFYKAFSWEKLKDANNIMDKPEIRIQKDLNPESTSMEVKKTAEIYGASITGICKLNSKWLYSEDMEGESIDIPDEFKFAIVMAIEMNRDYIRESPDFNAATASGLGYSKIAFLISCMSEFIRFLGYRAIPMGNDTALSIPMAIDAGLGELGRNGLLITPQYGPCVRICKILTDLPLKPDSPINFGVRDFCRNCYKCAEACEVDAIQYAKEPSYNIVCPSNNEGILRWAVNHDKCYKFWIENGSDCSTCIASCPFFRNTVYI